MAAVAFAVGAISLTARVGDRYLEISQIDAAADAVALAMASGDHALSHEVARWNRVRITSSEITGDHESGFDVWVTVEAMTEPGEDVADQGSFWSEYRGQARASTKP